MKVFPLFLVLCMFFITACREEENVIILSSKADSNKPTINKLIVGKIPKQMRHCTPCHPIKEGAKHKIGPNLYGIVGREVGTTTGYRNYSREYLTGKWIWTRENIDLLINRKYGTPDEAVRKLTGNPKARTKMKFYGASDSDTQVILDYLEGLK